MENELILSVKNLNTTFRTDGGDIKIVKQFNLDVKRGITLAIVGESGCGKSVTVNSICRLLGKNAIIEADKIDYYQKSDSGVNIHPIAEYKNYDNNMRSLRGKDIGMIFQDPMSSLNPVYKVGEQVAEGLMQHYPMKKKEALEKVVEMFKLLGIPDPENRINNYPHEFSGGMKQRVVIAIAMINNPDLLIADEPTTALDVTIQMQIMELMTKLKNELNKTIVLITHNMGLVAEIADEVAVMYMGRIVEYGSVEAIFTNPSHPYTAALLKSVPVLGLEEGQLLETIPGQTPNPKDIKQGCEFANRCSSCTERCLVGTVPNHEIEPAHNVRCHLFVGHKEVE